MKKIFILDDNAMKLESSIAVLQNEFEVMCCRDIVTASKRMTRFSFDLIVIDLMLPTRGLEIANEFNAGFNFYKQYVEKSQHGKPVVFWSNLTDAGYTAFMIREGNPTNLYFLQKGDANSLYNKVKKILTENEKKK